MRLAMVGALAVVLVQSLPADGVTLKDCVDAALVSNPGIQASAQRVEAARKMIGQARSAFYPQVYVSGNYTTTDNAPQAFMMSLNQRKLDMRAPEFDPNWPGDTDNIRFSVGAEFRVFDGGQRFIEVTKAKLGKQARQARLRTVQNELIYQVVRGYYGVLEAEAFVVVQQESIESLKESLRVSRGRFSAGSVFKTDVLNLEVKLAQAQEDLIKAQNGVQLAIAALNTAIGKDIIPPAGLPAPAEQGECIDPAKQGMGTIDRRPELAAAKRMTLLKEREYSGAIRGYSPVINAFGSYDWDTDYHADPQGSYTVGVSARWDLFTGFRRPSAIAEKKAEWRASQRDQEKIRADLRLDLKQAYLRSVEAFKRVSVVKKSVESAEEALRITSNRYKEGAANITELLTAQVGLTAMRTRKVAACYDYLTAMSNVRRAQGELIADFGAN